MLTAHALLEFRQACQRVDGFVLREHWSRLPAKWIEEAFNPIASNVAPMGERPVRLPDEPMEDYIVRHYKPDIHKELSGEGESKGNKKYQQMAPEEQEAHTHDVAVKSTARQKANHGRLTAMLGRVLGDMNSPHGPGVDIHAVASGWGHEQAFRDDELDPKHRLHGYEYQQWLVDSANARNQEFGISNAHNHQWSAYDGDMDDLTAVSMNPASEVHHDWEQRLGKLPQGGHNALYAKHACGGLTDGALKRAAEGGHHTIVGQTCCSDRYAGVSYEILARHRGMPWSRQEVLDQVNAERKTQGLHPLGRKSVKTDLDADNKVNFGTFEGLVKTSQHKGTPRGMRAQQEIDKLRHQYLREQGYHIRHGWFAHESGKPDPSGGWFIATRKDMPELTARAQHPDVTKGVHTLYDHHDGELEPRPQVPRPPQAEGDSLYGRIFLTEGTLGRWRFGGRKRRRRRRRK